MHKIFSEKTEIIHASKEDPVAIQMSKHVFTRVYFACLLYSSTKSNRDRHELHKQIKKKNLHTWECLFEVGASFGKAKQTRGAVIVESKRHTNGSLPLCN